MVKFILEQAMKQRVGGPEGEQMYSPTLPLTSALDGMGGLRHAPAALHGKDQVPNV
jgi:hypothetical protein